MSFLVHIQPGDLEFTVEPGETVLDAALRQRIGLPYSCRGGTCGSCVGDLLAGTVVYPSGAPDALTGLGPQACALCQAVPTADLTCRLDSLNRQSAHAPRILPCRVEGVDHLNHDVARLYLKLPDGQRLPFQAGQYLDFLLKDGQRRAFSIANPPHDDALIELHIRHVPGGAFTDYVFEQLHTKEILRIQAPLGRFTLVEPEGRPLLFLAGGTGFAPIKGMLEQLFFSHVRCTKLLYWGVRARRDLYLPDLPKTWASEQAGFRYVPVLSEPDPDWDGRTGFVHQAVMDDLADLSHFDIYMAGPPVMVHAARDSFIAAGADPARMFSDAFEYAPKPPKEPLT